MSITFSLVTICFTLRKLSTLKFIFIYLFHMKEVFSIELFSTSQNYTNSTSLFLDLDRLLFDPPLELLRFFFFFLLLPCLPPT